MENNNISQAHCLSKNERTERPFSLEKIAKAIHSEHLLKSLNSKYRDLLIKRLKPRPRDAKAIKRPPEIPYEHYPFTQKLHYNNLNDNVAILELPQIGFHYPFSFNPTLISKRSYPTRNRDILKPIPLNNQLIIKNELMNEIHHFTKKVSLDSYCINSQRGEDYYRNVGHRKLLKCFSAELDLRKSKPKISNSSLVNNDHHRLDASSDSQPKQTIDSNNSNTNQLKSLSKNDSSLPLLFITTSHEKPSNSSKPKQKQDSKNNAIIKQNSQIAINCLQSSSEDKLPKDKIVFSRRHSKSLILLKDDQTYNRIKQLDHILSTLLQRK